MNNVFYTTDNKNYLVIGFKIRVQDKFKFKETLTIKYQTNKQLIFGYEKFDGTTAEKFFNEEFKHNLITSLIQRYGIKSV